MVADIVGGGRLRVGFQNLEPSYKNYALEKLWMYHSLQGDECHEYLPIMAHTFDTIYCFSIFTFTDKSIVDPRAICGGTGFDINKKLPGEVDKLRPKVNFGFTSRGCIRNCSFCVVREKEGDIRPEADIYDIWDGKTKEITLYDNNILALPDHFKLICEQLHKERIKVDFNQGLDIRLIDNDVAQLLSTEYIRHAQYHFAFDNSRLDSLVESKISILKSHGINRSIFYVLVGCKDKPNKTVQEDIEDALYRLNLLKLLGQNAHVMRYRRIHDGQPESLINKETEKYYIPLANWGSVKQAHHAMDFLSEYLDHERGKPYKKYYQELGFQA